MTVSGEANIPFNQERYYEIIYKLDNIAAGWNGGYDELERSLDSIKRQINDENIHLALYKQEIPASSPMPEIFTGIPNGEAIWKSAVSLTGNHTLILDHTALFIQTIGEYRIILVNSQYVDPFNRPYGNIYIITLAVFGLTVLIVITTNYFLTRIMIKKYPLPQHPRIGGKTNSPKQSGVQDRLS
jgi:hypothetical protein